MPELKKILAINCGSSTLKFQVLEIGKDTPFGRERRQARGIADMIGGAGTIEFETDASSYAIPQYLAAKKISLSFDRAPLAFNECILGRLEYFRTGKRYLCLLNPFSCSFLPEGIGQFRKTPLLRNIFLPDSDYETRGYPLLCSRPLS